MGAGVGWGGVYVVGSVRVVMGGWGVMGRVVKVCNDELELVLVNVKDEGETLSWLIVEMHITSLRATAHD